MKAYNESDVVAGMLFLYDVIDSSSHANSVDVGGDVAFYDTLISIADKAINSINSDYRHNIVKLMNTGDGCYFFSDIPEDCLHLWKYLNLYFLNLKLDIRCGAGFGKVKLSSENIGTRLASEVNRFCSIAKNRELIVSEQLFKLIKTNPLFENLGLHSRSLRSVNLKGFSNPYNLVSISNTDIHSSYQLYNIPTGKIFIGRDAILSDAISIVRESIGCNCIAQIIGPSGAGKTTLAHASVKELNYLPIIIDLRTVCDIRMLHKSIIDTLYDTLVSMNLDSYIEFKNVHTILDILSAIDNHYLIFDHAELLLCNSHDQLMKFIIALNDKHIHMILTTTNSLPVNNTKEYFLKSPSDDEKISMLRHWINADIEWVNDIGKRLINHAYLICLIGKNCRGTYTNREELVRTLDFQLYGVSDIVSYLRFIIDTLTDEDRIWLYLASLSKGIINLTVVPPTVIEAFSANGLIERIESNYIVFHPLIIHAAECIEESVDVAKKAYDYLVKQSNGSKALISFYSHRCAALFDIDIADTILFDNWQLWSEEIDSFTVQALLEDRAINTSLYCTFKLYTGTIMLFQGDSFSIKTCSQIFNKYYLDSSNSAVIRLLALIQFIEADRKQNGPHHAVNYIFDYMSDINRLLDDCSSMLSPSYGYFYHLGTFYFILGNILRSLGDYQNAITVYQYADSLIMKEKVKINNAELQRVHIAYGIAVCYFKAGQHNMAIELAKEKLRVFKNSTKFGRALLNLLEARAHLCNTFIKVSSRDYIEGIRCVINARALFEEIRLPFYIYRCLLVEAAYQAKIGNHEECHSTLSILKSKVSESSSEIIKRANILDSYVGYSSNNFNETYFEQIEKRKGVSISNFYRWLMHSPTVSQDYRKNSTISLYKGLLTRSTLQETNFISRADSWLVD